MTKPRACGCPQLSKVRDGIAPPPYRQSAKCEPQAAPKQRLCPQVTLIWFFGKPSARPERPRVQPVAHGILTHWETRSTGSNGRKRRAPSRIDPESHVPGAKQGAREGRQKLRSMSFDKDGHCQTNLSGPAKGAGLRAFRPPADATRPGRQNG